MGELHTVISDGYDRECFDHALMREPAVQRALERIARLIPHARPLLADLYASLFKLNVVVREPHELEASVLLNQRLLSAVARSRGLRLLRERTQLDEVAAGGALVVVADEVILALTRDRRVVASDLMGLHELAEKEEEKETLQRELEHLESMGEEGFDEATRAKLKESLEGEVKALAKRIATDRKAQEALAQGLPLDVEAEVNTKLSRVPEQMGKIDEDMRGLGLGAGGEGRVSAADRMELGERLLKSKKLQLLARLTGAFREVAFEARRKRVIRAPQELHSVTRGAEVERLLPSELLGLSKKRRALHLEFLRRLVEGELLQYKLHAPASRGPMVVCVDGSGSMHGSKELWAKAVALTLMEIARREKRRCLALIFSSGHPPFEVELLGEGGARSGRGAVRDKALLDFAEHFPGGGTSFEEPLERAVAAVTEGEYRRGDIVFITDGEAEVSDALVKRIEKEQKKHRFAIHGVLVDAGHARMDALERISDHVRRVSDLTADSMKDLFEVV